MVPRNIRDLRAVRRELGRRVEVAARREDRLRARREVDRHDFVHDVDGLCFTFGPVVLADANYTSTIFGHVVVRVSVLTVRRLVRDDGCGTITERQMQPLRLKVRE